MNFGSYWFSDKIVLAMYGAQPISEAEAPRLHAVVRRLALKAQIGIIDGAWAEKRERSEEIAAQENRKRAELKNLIEQFQDVLK